MSSQLDGNGYPLSDMYTNSTAPQQRSLLQPEPVSSSQASSISGANFQYNANVRRIPEIYEHPNQQRKKPLKWMAIFLNAGIIIGGSILFFKQHKKMQRQKKDLKFQDDLLQLWSNTAKNTDQKNSDLQEKVKKVKIEKDEVLKKLTYTEKDAENYKKKSADFIVYMYKIIQEQKEEIQEQKKIIQEQKKQIKTLESNELEPKIYV